MTLQNMAKNGRIGNIIKSLLFCSFFYLRLFDLILKLLTRVRRDHPCIILVYHRIVDDRSNYLNKSAVVHHHLKDFETEIAYFKRNFQMISMDEVVSHMKLGKGFRRPSIAITFDDGYLDNYTLAYPVLKKHAVTATIYITTGLIGTPDKIWTEKIGLAFLETKKDYFNFSTILGDITVPIKTMEEKEQAYSKVSKALKLRPDDERRELVQVLFEKLEVNEKSGRHFEERMMLNWDEIQEMRKDGITIGSHSHTHPILSRMPIQKAKDEILNSKKIAEKNVDTKVRHFSFPNGREEDFSEELRDYCREIGFESICSVIYGTNDASEGNAFALKRVGAISPVSMLAGELIRLVCKRPTASQHPDGMFKRENAKFSTAT
jgi:peptidoglycan/xylan/chitin deacetylase (PgdA/CDA1 family)